MNKSVYFRNFNAAITKIEEKIKDCPDIVLRNVFVSKSKGCFIRPILIIFI